MRVALFALVSCLWLVGCGDPQLYPITGKVTLGGRPYERLLVYLHPLDQKAGPFTIGVGETTKDGTLGLRSTAGDGLAAGRYRASFACYVVQGSGNKTVGLDSDKVDDNPKLVTTDIVPSPYGSPEESPVEFEVKARGDNHFEFDIPKS